MDDRARQVVLRQAVRMRGDFRSEGEARSGFTLYEYCSTLAHSEQFLKCARHLPIAREADIFYIEH